MAFLNESLQLLYLLGNCEIQSNQKILLIYETKQDKILSKLKVKGCENFCQIPWTFIKVLGKI